MIMRQSIGTKRRRSGSCASACGLTDDLIDWPWLAAVASIIGGARLHPSSILRALFDTRPLTTPNLYSSEEGREAVRACPTLPRSTSTCRRWHAWSRTTAYGRRRRASVHPQKTIPNRNGGRSPPLDVASKALAMPVASVETSQSPNPHRRQVAHDAHAHANSALWCGYRRPRAGDGDAALGDRARQSFQRIPAAIPAGSWRRDPPRPLRWEKPRVHVAGCRSDLAGDDTSSSARIWEPVRCCIRRAPVGRACAIARLLCACVRARARACVRASRCYCVCVHTAVSGGHRVVRSQILLTPPPRLRPPSGSSRLSVARLSQIHPPSEVDSMCSSGNDSFNNSRGRAAPPPARSRRSSHPPPPPRRWRLDLLRAGRAPTHRDRPPTAPTPPTVRWRRWRHGARRRGPPLMGHRHQQQQPWRRSILPRAVSPQVMPSGHHQLHAPSPQPPSPAPPSSATPSAGHQSLFPEAFQPAPPPPSLGSSPLAPTSPASCPPQGPHAPPTPPPRPPPPRCPPSRRRVGEFERHPRGVHAGVRLRPRAGAGADGAGAIPAQAQMKAMQAQVTAQVEAQVKPR